MAYKIQYTPEDNARYPKAKANNPFPWKGCLFGVCIVCSILLLRRYGIPDILIPGDPEVTTTAARNMVENLQQGSGVNEAVSVFCKEILRGAGF